MQSSLPWGGGPTPSEADGWDGRWAFSARWTRSVSVKNLTGSALQGPPCTQL